MRRHDLGRSDSQLDSHEVLGFGKKSLAADKILKTVWPKTHELIPFFEIKGGKQVLSRAIHKAVNMVHVTENKRKLHQEGLGDLSAQPTPTHFGHLDHIGPERCILGRIVLI